MSWHELYIPPRKRVCEINTAITPEITCQSTASNLEIVHQLVDIQVYLHQRTPELREQLVTLKKNVRKYKKQLSRKLKEYGLTSTEFLETFLEPELNELWERIEDEEEEQRTTEVTISQNEVAMGLIKMEIRRRSL